MKNSLEEIENKDILSHLQWYVDTGVDETIDHETLDWFTLPQQVVQKTSILENSAVLRKAVSAKISTPKTLAMRTVNQIAEKADLIARSCNNLESLNEAIKNFEGSQLKSMATHTVFSDGNMDRGIMIIGDAPGVAEDRMGKPFVGENGQLLDKMFKAIGLNRDDDFYVTNILPWRPPGNRSPTPDEITICMPFIKRHIDLIAPKIIILLGGICAGSLLNTDVGITRLRGKWANYNNDGIQIPVRPLLHPAYLIKQPKTKKDTWHDLLEIKNRIKELAL